MMLIVDEDDRRYPYDCGTGQRLYGDIGQITIGIGHNLNGRPLSDAVTALLFSEDWAIALDTCHGLFPAYKTFTQARRLALLNMAFNLGERVLGHFRLMIAAVNNHDWKEAARAAENSLWFGQVKSRGERVVSMLRDDIIPPEYFQ